MKRVKYELSVKFYPYDHEYLGAREYLDGKSYIEFKNVRCYSFNFSGIYSIGLCDTKKQAKSLVNDFKNHFGGGWRNERFTIGPRRFELF